LRYLLSNFPHIKNSSLGNSFASARVIAIPFEFVPFIWSTFFPSFFSFLKNLFNSIKGEIITYLGRNLEGYFCITYLLGKIVATVDIKNINRVIENVEKFLRKKRGLEKGKEDFYVQTFEDMLKVYSGVLNIIVGFVILIALISVLVSAINTANTMITSVLERFKEIGVLKSIGAKNYNILGIFLFESAFLGFLAGIMGVLLGGGISIFAESILNNLGGGFLIPYYSTSLFLGLILFAGITGIVSGVIPAIKASKINTVDALRYE